MGLVSLARLLSPFLLAAAATAVPGAAPPAAAAEQKQQEVPAAKKVAEEDPRLHWAFVRKVYCILSLQLALTAEGTAPASLTGAPPRAACLTASLLSERLPVPASAPAMVAAAAAAADLPPIAVMAMAVAGKYDTNSLLNLA